MCTLTVAGVKLMLTGVILKYCLITQFSVEYCEILCCKSHPDLYYIIECGYTMFQASGQSIRLLNNYIITMP